MAENNLYTVKNHLLGHYALNDNHDLSANTYVNDTSWDPKYDMTASGFTGNVFTNITVTNRISFPDFILGYAVSDKIRIGYVSESVVPNSEVVDILFSPTNLINEDILTEFAMFDFNDPVGDPSDQYEDHYNDLDQWRKYYFTKNENNYNIGAYIRYIRNFDKAVFKMIGSLLPERARAHTGLLIEPHILDRTKYEWQKSSIDDMSYSASVDDIWDNYITFNGAIENDQEVRIYTTEAAQFSGSEDTFLETQRIAKTGSILAELYQFEGEYDVQISGSVVDPTMPYYEPADVDSVDNSIASINEQLSYATYVGTQNTSASDYEGAPWEVSESAGTIIRVIR